MINVPKPIPSAFVCSLEYKILINEKEYLGKYEVWPNTRSINNVDENCPYEFKFLKLNYTRDDLDKYIEFELVQK